jgi:chromatin remodeling complex protein RSC6
MRGDEVLVELTGLVSGTRAQYLKGIWQYIKDKKLQHPWSKRIIIPDEKFAKLMGIRGHAIQVFTMLRCMERHYQKNEDGNGTA